MAVEVDGTSKGLLGAFVVFAVGSGIASLVYGLLLLLRYISVEYNFGGFNLFLTSILLIAVGSLLIITVILGVIGALKDIANVRLVTLVLLFILFAILAAVGIWGMVSFKTDRLRRNIDADINRFNDVQYDSLNEVSKKQADYLHRHYNCCTTKATGAVKPDSCCIVPGCEANTSLNNASKYFEKACENVHYETNVKDVFPLAIFTLAAAGVVLLALILYAVISQRARSGYAAVNRG